MQEHLTLLKLEHLTLKLRKCRLILLLLRSKMLNKSFERVLKIYEYLFSHYRCRRSCWSLRGRRNDGHLRNRRLTVDAWLVDGGGGKFCRAIGAGRCGGGGREKT